ncbi:TPA: imidazole glycerol phosphate synthase subunit HisH [Candidatus Galligastranaerophilus faecipullorum]|nr:imidazole glycerol phosphate synthase subunit HisH [Candidatus Galligastranaerophilus faecipullorum]
MSNKVVIIDYGAGNVKSLGNMLEFLGAQYEITGDKNKILAAEKIIFPGQGHFEQALKKLEEHNMPDVIKEAISKGADFLGICLGLQVLFEKSEEAPGVKGLGIFKGEVKKFQKGKTPQIGWNNISVTPANTYLEDDYFYFVNSYYVVPEDKSIISSITNYHIDFCSSVQKDNICAVQFHPEKSSDAGIRFFKKWLNK